MFFVFFERRGIQAAILFCEGRGMRLVSYLSALSSASWAAFTESGLKRFSPRFMWITTHAPIFSTSIFLLQAGTRLEGGAHPSLDLVLQTSPREGGGGAADPGASSYRAGFAIQYNYNVFTHVPLFRKPQLTTKQYGIIVHWL